MFAEPSGRAVLRRGFAVSRLLGLRVRIPPEIWMSLVSVVCCEIEVSATAHRSSRGVLQSVVCLIVIVKNRKRGGSGPLGSVAPWGIKISLCS
jgi:hypothetical protein